MKTKVLLFMLGVLGIMSCQKEEETAEQHTDSGITYFPITVSYSMGNGGVEFDSTQLVNSSHIQIHDCKFLVDLSKVQEYDGVWSNHSVRPLLIDRSKDGEELLLGQTRVWSDSLEITLGINSLNNFIGELESHHPEMYISENLGHKFIELSLTVDSNSDGVPETPVIISCYGSSIIHKFMVKPQFGYSTGGYGAYAVKDLHLDVNLEMVLMNLDLPNLISEEGETETTVFVTDLFVESMVLQ